MNIIIAKNVFDDMTVEELLAKRAELLAKLNAPKVNDVTRVFATGALKLVNEALTAKGIS
ncbi:hypothetical protein UFOVP1382_29 [uncultured Caudovirales phage]|uniref:Uncharacterized protein n=1 Tax=uncultured Caudovirales phage TaxID=2100421 RepID=A0A6J5S0H1_9CAUD|nr:hypothetical protein UFOVP1382_29 [uncultured Caudovirales phage]